MVERSLCPIKFSLNVKEIFSRVNLPLHRSVVTSSYSYNDPAIHGPCGLDFAGWFVAFLNCFPQQGPICICQVFKYADT